MKLYHFTEKRNLKSILRDGLVLGKRHKESYKLFLTDRQSIVKNPGYWVGYGSVVLLVDVPKSWICEIGYDKDFDYGQSKFKMYRNPVAWYKMTGYRVCRNIPVDRILDWQYYKAY